METLDKYNNARLEELKNPPMVMAEVSCPKCGNELHYNGEEINKSMPRPSRNVLCGNCGYEGAKLI